MELKFRNLTKDEIEVRLGGGGSILLYKTARTDANILDESGLKWQCKFYQVKNTMFCSIGIYDEDLKEWVWRDDCGDDDYTMEQVKAEASDCFKRAGFKWNIGRRNLYSAPKIRTSDLPREFQDSKYFEVGSIGYDENGNITDLTITTNFGKDIVYLFKNGRKVALGGGKAPNKPIVEDKQKVVPINELQEIPFEVETKEEAEIGELGELHEVVGTIRQTDKTIIFAYVNGLTNQQKDIFYAWLNKLYFTRDIARLSEKQGVQIVKKISEKQNGK